MPKSYLPPYGTGIEESVISASLNSSMLFTYLMGVYTMVYAGTMYLHMSRKPANKGYRIIWSTISVLYVICMGIFIIQWYYLNLAVVTDGDTRKSIFISTLQGGSLSLYAFNEFLFYSVFIVSDGLLVWRCYHVWGMSRQVIIVPSALLFAEFGIVIVITAMSALDSPVTTNTGLAKAEAGVVTARAFVSFATSVITTSLITYKIRFSSRTTDITSKNESRNSLIIISESAIVHSLTMLFYAIIVSIPSQNLVGTPLSNAEYYIQAVVTVAAGMTPTVLVARMAMAVPNSTVAQSITNISGLQFQAQQGSGRSGSTNIRSIVTAIHEADGVLNDEEKRMQ